MRRLTLGLVLCAATSLAVSCDDANKAAPTAPGLPAGHPGAMPGAMPGAHPGAMPGAMPGAPGGGMQHGQVAASASAAAGIVWTAPSDWTLKPARPMRIATWSIKKAAGDVEDGECAAFFFGAGQGGDVEANIQRWYGQLKPSNGKTIAETAKRTEIVADGVKVIRVDAKGTFMWSATPMSPQTIPKPNYRLLGAIAQAPGGSVFFKLTAPAKTAAAAEAAFDALLASIKKK